MENKRTNRAHYVNTYIPRIDSSSWALTWNIVGEVCTQTQHVSGEVSWRIIESLQRPDSRRSRRPTDRQANSR